MKELIFNIGDVFNATTTSGCLSQYEVSCFHIPAYQRGYKWGTGVGGAVTVLLDDIWSAFERKESEYYLQYITVKRQFLSLNGFDTHCLEVIDGQQRLTTLSILLSVLYALQGEASEQLDNIADGKLHYAIRRNFFDEYIYDKEKLQSLSELDWDSLIEESPDMDKQDIFYLHSALLKCFEFMEGKDIGGFYQYLSEAVKLIVNSVEAHIESETVFKNLNSNKVALTETELIKGLLITRTGRGRVDNASNSFREVLEVRLGLGKTWEHIQQWSQTPEIRSFYFEYKEDSLFELLWLTAMMLDEQQKLKKHKEGVYPLFDFYNQFSDLNTVFHKLNEIQQRLADWYETDEIYHLIGFCRHAKNNSHNNLLFIQKCLQTTTKKALVDKLTEEKDRLIYGDNTDAIKDLHYGQDNDQIHAVLMVLSVFPMTIRRSRFDFNAFKKQDWSLEHIFPQAPEGKGHILTESQKKNIRDMLGDVSEKVDDILKQKSRTPEEREVYENALREIGVLDNIGNMCLLARNDNSALGNQFFEGKRKKVLSLIQQGSFVPKHTFDVFSRMIDGLDGNIEQWSANDIEVHLKYISKIFASVEGEVHS